MAHLEQLAAIVGASNVIAGDLVAADTYLIDKRKRYHGKALAVVTPETTEQVAAVVRWCNQEQIAVVPQGGNTGLMGGATPGVTGQNLLLSLSKMNRVRELDIDNNTITVEAGMVLRDIQQITEAQDRLFPLSFGAEKWSQIGGNLSTNAGGMRVLNYGNAKDLALGLEVVTADGEIWDGLHALRKDNSSYNLKDLFIGAEGTLGIITAAVMKLYPLPKVQLSAFIAFPAIQQAVTFLSRARGHFGPGLTAFELISGASLVLAKQQVPHYQQPFSDVDGKEWFALVELSDYESSEHAHHLFRTLLEQAGGERLITRSVIAETPEQTAAFWSLRKLGISDAQLALTKNQVKHDISIPTSRFPAFITESLARLQQQFPQAVPIVFGHLGDGNLHYNISLPHAKSHADYLAEGEQITTVLHDLVVVYRGSVCAEHGIGQVKVHELEKYKTPVEKNLMRRLKQALDPQGLLNPGKVVPQS